MRRHLGYYVHHHGSGHARRARQVLAHTTTPCDVLSSSPLVDPGAIQLPLDVGGPTHEHPLPSVLHHAPIGHRGLRARVAALGAWFERADPAALVVDVSVEVALLARIAGVAPVVVRQHGRRTDDAHRAAYEAAEMLLAFWPRWAEDAASQELRDRTHYVGGTSCLAGGALERTTACRLTGLDPDDRHVVVVRGFGGDSFEVERIGSAARATPDHRWIVVGPEPLGSGGTSDPWVQSRGVVGDLRPLLSAADVVVTHGGQNAVMDAAAVGAALVVIPQPRPFDEQAAFATVLLRHGCAVVRPTWPPATDWPAVLATAQDTDRTRLASLAGGGARAAARLLDGLAAELSTVASDPPGDDAAGLTAADACPPRPHHAAPSAPVAPPSCPAPSAAPTPR